MTSQNAQLADSALRIGTLLLIHAVLPEVFFISYPLSLPVNLSFSLFHEPSAVSRGSCYVPPLCSHDNLVLFTNSINIPYQTMCTCHSHFLDCKLFESRTGVFILIFPEPCTVPGPEEAFNKYLFYKTINMTIIMLEI